MKQLISTLGVILFLSSIAVGDDSRAASEQCYNAASQAFQTIERAYWRGTWGDDFEERSNELFGQVCHSHCRGAVFQNGDPVNCTAVRTAIMSRGNALAKKSAARRYLESLQRITFSFEQGRSLNPEEFYQIQDGVIHPDELNVHESGGIAL